MVAIGDTHTEPLNFYWAPTAPSGERKGPALRAMDFPLNDIEQQLIAETAPVITAARERNQVIIGQKKKLQKEAVNCDDEEERQRLLDEIIELERSLVFVPPGPSW